MNRLTRGAFSETTPDVRTLSLEGSSPETLPQFVREANRNVGQETVHLTGEMLIIPWYRVGRTSKL